MASPYLIADEQVRGMVKALERVPCDHLGSNQARAQAYRLAGIALGNLALDPEAMKRQRIRRRQLGVTVFALTVIASVQHAAASTGMEAISGELGQSLIWAAEMAGILLAGLSFFVTVLYLLRMLSAWLGIRHRERVLIEHNAADEIWP